MKAFPISKFYTLVFVLMVTVTGWTQESLKQCLSSCKSSDYVKDCTDTNSNANQTTCINNMLRECKQTCNTAASEARSESKDEKSSCNTLRDAFLKSNEDIKTQCALAGKDSTEDCKKLANSCSANLNFTEAEEGSEETDTQKVMKTFWGVIAPKYGLPDGAAGSAECTIEDDEKEQDRSEKYSEKISRLRADIASLKEDSAKADDDVAKKKQDVEEKIIEIEKEIDRKKNEKKTEDQKETAKMQQEALDAIKRKKESLKKIEERTRVIASLRLTQQEEAIKFSKSNLMKACRDQALELKAKLIENASKKTQGTATTGNIKHDVETFAKQCIKLAAVEKSKALKATQDRISAENSNIKDLQESVKLDEKASANRLKDLEARKKIGDEDMTKAEERRTQELSKLNQKVIDMQTLVDKKKSTHLEKIAAKETEINEALLKMANKKPRFQKISGKIKQSSIQVSGFVDECCDYKDSKGKEPYKAVCLQLKSDYPDEARSVKPKTRK